MPDVQRDVVLLPTCRIVVGDLLAPGTTTSNLIQYQKEKTFTNAAAAVAEGAAKPESTLVYQLATSPVQKVAHWIPASEEMLEDYAQTQSIIDGRLRTGVQLVEDDELLNGSGVTLHLLGFLHLPGLAAAVARGADTIADAIAKQIGAIETAMNLPVDGIVMNPIDWLSVQLSKLADGSYASGTTPLAAAIPSVLWGLPVARTTAIAQGTALVGCFRTAAGLFRKPSGIRVEASNSHSDFFIKNLVAIRAEERLALAVYREAAFGLVTGLEFGRVGPGRPPGRRRMPRVVRRRWSSARARFFTRPHGQAPGPAAARRRTPLGAGAPEVAVRRGPRPGRARAPRARERPGVDSAPTTRAAAGGGVRAAGRPEEIGLSSQVRSARRRPPARAPEPVSRGTLPTSPASIVGAPAFTRGGPAMSAVRARRRHPRRPPALPLAVLMAWSALALDQRRALRVLDSAPLRGITARSAAPDAQTTTTTRASDREAARRFRSHSEIGP